MKLNIIRYLRYLSPVPCWVRELPSENDFHLKMTLLVSLRRRHCSFWSQFGCARQKANIFNHKCITQPPANGFNFAGQQLATVFNIVGSCSVRLRVALGLSVKKYLLSKDVVIMS